MEPKRRNIAVMTDCMHILLTLLLLWACEALRLWGVLLLPLCLLPLTALCTDRRWVAYPVAVLLAGGLILAMPLPHYAWFGFVTVLSWYAPVRRLLVRKTDVIRGGLAAFGLCVLATALGLWGLWLLGANPFAGMAPPVLVVLAFTALIGFLLYDVAFQLFAKLWTRVLKKPLSV